MYIQITSDGLSLNAEKNITCFLVSDMQKILPERAGQHGWRLSSSPRGDEWWHLPEAGQYHPEGLTLGCETIGWKNIKPNDNIATKKVQLLSKKQESQG